MLAVDCGSAAASAWRALMAATCAGVACFGATGTLSQKPRALMISAGVCDFASILTAGAATSLEGLVEAATCTVCMSAEASWKVEVNAGLERGTGTASAADLPGRAAAIKAAGTGLS